MAAPTTEANALVLMSLLLEEPADRDTIIEQTGWSAHQFRNALNYLRQRVCTQVGALLPRPVHDDGYLYHLLDADHPDRPAFWRGSATATGDVESRLRNILRDVSTYRDIVDGRTVEGRKVRLVEQRIRHLVEDLDLMEEMDAELQAVPS